MKSTAPYQGPAHPPWWQVSESYEHQGTPVALGQQLTLAGGRTVFTFVNHTVAPPRPGSGKRRTAEWITVLGPGGYRSVRPGQIGKVLPPVRRRPGRKTPGP
jgi:hypothetical protein